MREGAAVNIGDNENKRDGARDGTDHVDGYNNIYCHSIKIEIFFIVNIETQLILRPRTTRRCLIV